MANETATNPAIRPYRAADYAGVLRGMQDLQDYERALHPSRRSAAEAAEAYLQRLLQRVAERSGAIFVAEDGGAVIGFIACYVKDTESLIETAAYSRYGYVSDLDIAAEWRGRGLAQRLLAVAEQHLRAARRHPPAHRRLAANVAAQRAYARYGFAPYESELEKPIASPLPEERLGLRSRIALVRPSRRPLMRPPQDEEVSLHAFDMPSSIRLILRSAVRRVSKTHDRMAAFLYILRCRDGAYYVGTTRESLEVRVAQHNDGFFGGFTSLRRTCRTGLPSGIRPHHRRDLCRASGEGMASRQEGGFDFWTVRSFAGTRQARTGGWP